MSKQSPSILLPSPQMLKKFLNSESIPQTCLDFGIGWVDVIRWIPPSDYPRCSRSDRTDSVLCWMDFIKWMNISEPLRLNGIFQCFLDFSPYGTTISSEHRRLPFCRTNNT